MKITINTNVDLILPQLDITFKYLYHEYLKDITNLEKMAYRQCSIFPSRRTALRADKFLNADSGLSFMKQVINTTFEDNWKKIETIRKACGLSADGFISIDNSTIDFLFK